MAAYKVTLYNTDSNAVVRPNASNEMTNILKNGDKEGNWNEPTMAYFNLLYQHSPGNCEVKRPSQWVLPKW